MEIQDIQPLQAKPTATPSAEAAPGFLSFKRGQHYYTSTGRKVGDFFLGFFGMWVVSWFISLLFLPLIYFGIYSYFLGYGIAFLVDILCIVLAFLFGRKWIGIGSLASVALGLVLSMIVLFFLFRAFGSGTL